jgi:cold shock CspA family protein
MPAADKQRAMPERAVGTLISWIAGRGFGFARCDHGEDVWIGAKDLVYSGITDDPQVGMRLSFEVRQDAAGRAPRAIHIQIMSEPPA